MAVIICCGFFVYNDIKVFKESSVSNKQSIAEVVGINAASALEFADEVAAHDMLHKLESNSSILNAVILDKDGKVFARYDKDSTDVFAFTANQQEGLNNFGNFGQQYLVSYSINGKEPLGTVVLRSELSGFGRIVLGYMQIAGVILIISLIGAFVISSFLQRAITNRLLALVASTRQVTETGNYAIRVENQEHDEIGTLSGAFNKMLDRIERIQANLYQANVELEERVKARTVELETANRELEQKSEELTRSNVELGQYAYVASHDLQEPLRTITNYVGLLEEKYSAQQDAETQMYIRFVVRAATTMKNLITHLLDFSKIGRNVALAPVDCNKLIHELKEEMQETIRQTGAHINAVSLPIVIGNAIELKQLMQNLISNSIKFRKKDIEPVIEITATEIPDFWLFTLSDNGIGMEKKYQEKIFVIFQRLHSVSEYPGTGIGLATCKKIVSTHQGNIWVESEPEQGSSFYFTISKHLKPT